MLPFHSHLLRGFAASLGAAMFALALPAAAQLKTAPVTADQQVAPSILVARIDQNCGVFRSAIQSQKPYDVVEAQTNVWKLVKDADIAALEKNNSFTTYAKAWKQAGNYVWVHAVTNGSKGGRHATQLCFRNDGTLMRVRQATNIPALDAAGASQAYFRSDGSLIQKTQVFALDDPAITKQVKQLPFFKNLP